MGFATSVPLLQGYLCVALEQRHEWPLDDLDVPAFLA